MFKILYRKLFAVFQILGCLVLVVFLILGSFSGGQNIGTFLAVVFKLLGHLLYLFRSSTSLQDFISLKLEKTVPKINWFYICRILNYYGTGAL